MPTLEKTTTWSDIYRDGAVFKITGDGMFRDIGVLETVRRYQSESRALPKQGIILARDHNGFGFHQFHKNQFEYRGHPEFELLEGIVSEYADLKPLERGIVFDNEKSILIKHINDNFPKNKIPWYNFTNIGAMFIHHGFKDIFETFRLYNLLDVLREPSNEVIIARSYTRPLFVEFTTKDLSAMDLIVNRKPRYTKKVPRIFKEDVSGHTTFKRRVPRHTIEVPPMDLSK